MPTWFLCLGQAGGTKPASLVQLLIHGMRPAGIGLLEHNSFKRHLPRQMQVGSLDLGYDYEVKEDKPMGTGGASNLNSTTEGARVPKKSSKKWQRDELRAAINFSLKYGYENESLIVNHPPSRFRLAAKDLCGTSDPYVKVYLLPDRKKFQTRVHRKMLNPTFNESFLFPVPYDELPGRKLHMSVFDFDRFSRHDMIGEVELDNLFELSDLSRETNIWRDIQYATTGGGSQSCTQYKEHQPSHVLASRR
uniref:C2 domain-containing protein n=1 Tax=Knipowitschia caucasica TaxID=637954 RepID=A0AAV2KJ94_KNICA